MNIAVVGCGKMGRMIEAVCARREDVQIAGFVGRGGCASLDELEEMDAALDFSAPENLPMLLSGAVRRRIPLVIGTTGMSGAQGEAIRAASRRIPIVWSENFSVGVTVLVRLARLAAQALGREFDMEIVETHHNRKVDAPSGTAKLILRQIDPEGLYAPVYGRSGRIGARGREIGVHAVRGGTAAGEHSLRFFGRSFATERTAGKSSPKARCGRRRSQGRQNRGCMTWRTFYSGGTDGRDRKAHSNGREKNAGQGLCSGEQAAAL